jgi:hypothetical protein
MAKERENFNAREGKRVMAKERASRLEREKKEKEKKRKNE